MKSKQRKPTTLSTKIEDGVSYCRKCCMTKSVSNFYETTDRYLDGTGYMSVCKDCIVEIYTQMFQSLRSHEKKILRICQLFNIRYDQNALDASVRHIKQLRETP